ncbi:MAG TPA: hypothetical protein VL742_16400 [Casimicrobiaceae bacterium]|nr:hypothetical protein [Casimicrobiaceae bacterium]
MAYPFRVPRAAATLGVAALALSLSPPLLAATDADVAAIRAELKQLRESYEAHLQALEQRLKEAEAREAASTPPAPPSAGTSSGIAAFNPAISAVLQGTYSRLTQDPSQYRLAGFLLDPDVMPGRRGLSLGESEVALSANVDDKFAGNLVVSLTPENTVEVEEAYGIATALPYGLTPKFGRFFSAHLADVLATLERTPAKMVIRAAYQSDRASQWIAERAKLKAVVLPFTVGGDDAAKDLFGLFDDTIQRLLKGAQ